VDSRNDPLDEFQQVASLLSMASQAQLNGRLSAIPEMIKSLSSLNESDKWGLSLVEGTDGIERYEAYGSFIGAGAGMIRGTVPQNLESWGLELHGEQIFGFLQFSDRRIYFNNRNHKKRTPVVIEVRLPRSVLEDLNTVYRDLRHAAAAADNAVRPAALAAPAKAPAHRPTNRRNSTGEGARQAA
jgi:hypothetical protein